MNNRVRIHERIKATRDSRGEVKRGANEAGKELPQNARGRKAKHSNKQLKKRLNVASRFDGQS